MRRREQDPGARLERQAAERKPFLDRARAVVAGRDDVGVDVDESGHLSTVARRPGRPASYSAATNARMRSTACSRLSSDEAYEMRRWSVAVAAEGAAREHRDPGLVEQPLGELVGAERQRRDVRERVERTTGLDAADARDRVERRHEVVAAAAELGHHLVHRVLRALERRDAGELGERRHARRRVDDQARQRVDELGRARRRSRAATPSSRTSSRSRRGGSCARAGPGSDAIDGASTS